VLDFAPSTYYAAKKREREKTERDIRDEYLREEIMRVWMERSKSRGKYGARKIWHQLNRDGIEIARCTVERLMREMGIGGSKAVRKKPRTTVPAPAGTERPSDQLERDFTANAPNRRWVADITYVETVRGFVYTAFIMDLFSRKIVGWQVGDTLRAELALDALEMAIWRAGDGLEAGNLIHHSDRGVQYTSIRYAERLEEVKAVRSVGSKGDSYDNAAAESLNSLYKKELIDSEGPWNGVTDVTLATLEWVSWYNKERLHSACGYVPPEEFEESYYASLGTVVK
jgi:putative transposase